MRGSLLASAPIVVALLTPSHPIPRPLLSSGPLDARHRGARRAPRPLLSTAPLDSKRRQLDRSFAQIAAPAFVQLSAEPFSRLVDTAYMGRLGANALGGAGAAIAAQYALGKLYNDPLLRTTISLVAATENDADPTRRSHAISASLGLALLVGLLQGAVCCAFTGPVLRACCVPASSPMQASAAGYLRVCALGAPVTTLWLATNGIFRGLGDTRTPLGWALAFTLLNAALSPVFIFRCGWGAAGAALGTALAQALALVPLLLALREKLRGLEPAAAQGGGATPRGREPAHLALWALFTPPGGLAALRGSLAAYASAGGLVLLRSVGKISAYSICAREAARLGAVASAAHNVCYQVGVATTQLCEAFAIATQSLLAREVGSDGGAAGAADGRAERTAAARHIVARGLSFGGAAACTLSLATYLNRDSVLRGITTIPEVRAACRTVMPLVLLCQALKGLAYPVSGALMGGSDWSYSAASMWCAQLATLAIVAGARRSGSITLNQLWVSLAANFATQIGTGALRLASGRGPWEVLRRSRGPKMK